MLLTITFTVMSVSGVMLYLSSNMIFQDKKAYLYDNAFTSLGTSNFALEQFFDGKKHLVSSYAAGKLEDEKLITEQFAKDNDLFKVTTFTPEEARAGKMFRNFFINQYFGKRYRKRVDFLDVSYGFLAETAERAIKEKMVERLFFEGKAPHYLVFLYHEANNTIYCFDYLLDKLLDNFFTKQSFNISLISQDGESLFNNKPLNSTPEHKPFYKIFIEKELADKEKKYNSGVKEADIGKSNYILGYKHLDRFPGHFIFTGIKTDEAYEVTTILIMNTILYALALIGFFNIISVFIARTISNPLDKLVGIIGNIANGDFNARVEHQNTSELQIVGEAFNEMIQKIQDYRDKLEDYNKTLEKKVEERTISLGRANSFIKTMVDSLAQGLLVFDKKGTCSELYTKACEKLLGTKPTGRNLASLIKVEDRTTFQEWVDNLYEEMIPFDSLVDLGQKSVPCDVPYTSKDFKHVTLEFFPMRGEDGKVQNVVMVASDKTREFKANKEVEAQQNYVKLVTKVIKDKNNFIRFTALFDDSLKSEIANIRRDGGIANKNDFMRLLHSMKGSAAFYSFREVVDYLHEFETDVSSKELPVEKIIERIEVCLEKLHLNIERLKDFIGDGSKRTVEVSENDMREFKQLLDQRDARLGGKFSELFLSRPVEMYIEQYKELVLELAPKLGKGLNPIVVKNGGLKVDMNFYQTFFDSCIHLFRNAVDHAIETPDKRLDRGKDEFGTITVNFDKVERKEGPRLLFSVQDDGNGIDAVRIRKKMAELGYPEDQLNEPDEKIIYHIFDPSFSTAESVTDVSGRGVGLFDIKENVIKMGGTLEISTEVAKGSIFSFFLPLQGAERIATQAPVEEVLSMNIAPMDLPLPEVDELPDLPPPPFEEA